MTSEHDQKMRFMRQFRPSPGKRLSFAREQAGLTQELAGAEAGMERRALRLWELDRAEDISAEGIRRLAKL